MYTMEEVREKLNAILQADNPGTTSEILVDLQSQIIAALSPRLPIWKPRSGSWQR